MAGFGGAGEGRHDDLEVGWNGEGRVRGRRKFELWGRRGREEWRGGIFGWTARAGTWSDLIGRIFEDMQGYAKIRFNAVHPRSK